MLTINVIMTSKVGIVKSNRNLNQTILGTILGTRLPISGIVINYGVSNNLMSESKHYEQQQPVSQWADLMGQLFDRLTGKEAVISYGFRNIEVDIPKAAKLKPISPMR